MSKNKVLNTKRQRRINRVRAKIFGSANQPRLAVFTSNAFSYAQLINDSAGKTLASASSRELKKTGKKHTKIQLAEMLGELIAKKAAKKEIKKAVFDRRSYKYHGRVKAIAEGARKAGLKI